MEDECNSLDDNWIAVKQDAFNLEEDKRRLQFDVAWNFIEKSLAISCRIRSRTAKQSGEGWASMFTLYQLQTIHERLAAVRPNLMTYLPILPVEPRGIWSYFCNTEPPSDKLCKDIEQYFQQALDICGEKLLLSVLFEQPLSMDDYFEQIGSLKRKYYEQDVQKATDCLNTLVSHRSHAVTLREMCDIYNEEDDCLTNIQHLLAVFYNYLLQPFLDLREATFNNLRQAKNILASDDVGDRVKNELRIKFCDWQKEYQEAIENIQNLYPEYYERVVDLFAGKSKFFWCYWCCC